MLKTRSKIRNKKITIIGIFVVVLVIFLLSNNSLVLAQELNVGLDYAEEIGLPEQDIRITIAKIIRTVIGFLGIIAVGLIMYAGWLWMSSEGNEEKIDQAKRILKNAIIGLIIILSSFAITSFIINKLTGSITGDFSTAGGLITGRGGGIAALGNDVIESHYPARNQKDVPRNTKIVVTFKEPIDAGTVIKGENINGENIKIYETNNGIDSSLASDDVIAYKTTDNKTFVFKPVQYLGSTSEKIWYTVALSKNIKKANGDLAFAGAIGEIGYDWSFEVGTYVDVTSPKVESVVPKPDALEPRNVVIQVNFDEAIDPVAASGATARGFNNIVITNETDSKTVAGNFYISNQYQTVEFLTEDACGVNSCGDTIYCLPGDKSLSTLVKAATLAVKGESAANFPYDGIVDMADNSLDGNKNGNAQGPESQSEQPPYNENNPDPTAQGDDYIWSFNTNNTIDITAPIVIDINPKISEQGVNLSSVPEATFNKLLMSSSLNTSNITIDSNPISELNYWISKADNMIDKQTTIKINHDQFMEDTVYLPQINSGVRDVYQNCYSPCSDANVTGSPSCCNGIPSTSSSCR